MQPAVTIEPKSHQAASEVARFLNAYAHRFGAGAFATPTAADLAHLTVYQWTDERHRTVLVCSHSRNRKDFTGQRYAVSGLVGTHLARTPGAPLPDLRFCNHLHTYVEDFELTRALVGAGWHTWAHQITASGMLVRCWGRRPGPRLRPADEVNLARLPVEVPDKLRRVVLSEVAGLAGWADDFPYYSDGSWSALNLAGFVPSDPTWGIKPSEMPRSWQEAHPETLAYECRWTTLARSTPGLVELTGLVAAGASTERVRLLRMAPPGGGRGPSTLARHTDITDRSAGTRDGAVVRLHMPLLTHPGVEMHHWDLNGRHHARHLEAWSCWYLDARKPHGVTNPTDTARVHLVVDLISDSSVRERIVGGEP